MNVLIYTLAALTLFARLSEIPSVHARVGAFGAKWIGGIR